MPQKKYALDIHEAQRLYIEWEGGLYYRQGDMRILLDGNLIGLIPADVDLKQAQEFVLPDHALLTVKRDGGVLQVFRNGEDLASIERLQNNLRLGWFMLALLGILDVAGGFVRIPGAAEPEHLASIQMLLRVCGILFLGLSLWARNRSKTAFILGMVLYVIQVVILFMTLGKSDIWEISLGVLTIVDLSVILLRAYRSNPFGDVRRKKGLLS